MSKMFRLCVCFVVLCGLKFCKYTYDAHNIIGTRELTLGNPNRFLHNTSSVSKSFFFVVFVVHEVVSKVFVMF